MLFASRGVLVDFSSKNKQKITKINGQTVYIVRRPVYSNKSNKLIGFAGGVADAINLEEKFENKLNEYSGNLERAAVELAQEWRGDRTLQKLEAMLIVIDKDNLLIVSGSGEVIAPDNGVLAIGSGGNYAQAAAVALSEYSKDMSAGEIAKAALNIAADIDIFTNHNIIVEELA